MKEILCFIAILLAIVSLCLGLTVSIQVFMAGGALGTADYLNAGFVLLCLATILNKPSKLKAREGIDG